MKKRNGATILNKGESVLVVSFYRDWLNEFRRHLEDDGASVGELEIWKMCLVILMVCIILVYYIFINCAPPHIKRRHLIRPLADRYSLTSTSFFQEERKKYAREQSI
ncbi:hypothetical protein T265_01067 [Opisthorchis viverrini]|uniref:Uncharacterized protein n=1 Tax=Opisthorchis viverrini TaxID=6198 RepID=A0A075AAY5_OPIVI|nr:hypothetical protein T265_01067 [Opisthorchis viverrini]KER32980.1 hypothetical protein T265_01067 [Opisthorchis viverrini]